MKTDIKTKLAESFLTVIYTDEDILLYFHKEITSYKWSLHTSKLFVTITRTVKAALKCSLVFLNFLEQHFLHNNILKIYHFPGCLSSIRLSGQNLNLPGSFAENSGVSLGCFSSTSCANITCRTPMSCGHSWGSNTCGSVLTANSKLFIKHIMVRLTLYHLIFFFSGHSLR